MIGPVNQAVVQTAGTAVDENGHGAE
jgi:hypothetical protein